MNFFFPLKKQNHLCQVIYASSGRCCSLLWFATSPLMGVESIALHSSLSPSLPTPLGALHPTLAYCALFWVIRTASASSAAVAAAGAAARYVSPLFLLSRP